MKIGQIGLVCGRKAQIVAIHDHSLRVMFLKSCDRTKMLDLLFTPFETNVPKAHWSRGEESKRATGAFSVSTHP